MAPSYESLKTGTDAVFVRGCFDLIQFPNFSRVNKITFLKIPSKRKQMIFLVFNEPWNLME